MIWIPLGTIPPEVTIAIVALAMSLIGGLGSTYRKKALDIQFQTLHH